MHADKQPHITTMDMDENTPTSPTFTDSAIGIDTTPDHDGESIRLAIRLAHLARCTSEKKTPCSRYSKSDIDTLHSCLDTLEKTLLSADNNTDGDTGNDTTTEDDTTSDDDPRAALTHELSSNRPRSRAGNISLKSSLSSFAEKKPLSLYYPPHSQQLSALLDEVTVLSDEIYDRRNEAFHIYDLFSMKCQDLEIKIDGLEDEIRELHADLHQNSIEREGLRGTVYSLDNWVDAWQREHEETVLKAREAQAQVLKKKRWTTKQQRIIQTTVDEDDTEALVDGIAAWMRGWKDIEEEFRFREAEREKRREERARLRKLLGSNANGQGIDLQRHGDNFHSFMQVRYTWF